jgi:hypothetical protein
LKSNKSKFIEIVEDDFRSLVKEKIVVNTSELPIVYIHCLKDIAESNNKFPFQTTSDYLGIIFNRKFDQTNSIRFWMFQEKRQKDKNKEYLSLMIGNELISQEQYDAHHQQKEMIQLELNKQNMLVLDFNALCSGSKSAAIYKTQLLKFFHTWVFYYFYCADHKFIKHILKSKFTFGKILFGAELNSLFTRYRKAVKFVYCNSKSDQHFESKYTKNHHYQFFPEAVLLEMHPYVVPLSERTEVQ